MNTEMNEWQQAIDDELVVLYLGTTETHPDPKEALRKIISCYVQIALDPAVSSDAQALVEQGKKQVGVPSAQADAAEAGQSVTDATIDLISKALRRAFLLGQTYWHQAESDSWAQNRRADETKAAFNQLVDETRAVLAAQGGGDAK